MLAWHDRRREFDANRHGHDPTYRHCPLTEFKRRPTEAIRRLKETGQPQVLTVNGRAEVVVQDVESYQRLLDLAERAETIEGIRRGLESTARGEGRTAEEIFAELRSRHSLASEALVSES
jgi:prevent-host-death family protein